MLTHRIPYPPDRGDRIRALNILREFARHWDVYLACSNDEPVLSGQLDYLRDFCVDVATVSCVGVSRWARAISSAVRGRSLTEGLFASPSLKQAVLRWEQMHHFDAVFCYCSSMYPYVRAMREAPPVVVDLVDVDSQKWAQHRQQSRNWKRWIYGVESRRVCALERELSERAEHVTLVSDEEVASFREHVIDSSRVSNVTNGVDTEYFCPAEKTQSEKGKTLITFVGVLDYVPNVEGIVWFADKVLPLLPHEEIELRIVGRRPSSAVKRLGARAGIQVYADVPDVREYLHETDIVIAPLRIARGVQNKVLEAMACGRPVVATSAAIEGIDGKHNEHALVAGDASDFAAQIRRLIEDRELGSRIGKTAHELVVSRYSWSARLAGLVEIMSNVIDRKKVVATLA